MAVMTIRDNALWAKHIEGDPALVRRILSLPENAPIMLVIDDIPMRFRKMRDGADGRHTPGLRPDAPFKKIWDDMQQRRGEVVSLRLEEQESGADPYLTSIEPLLSEWLSPEDAEAYDGL